MNVYGKGAMALVMAVLLAGAGAALVVQRTLPARDGLQGLRGLSAPVQVRRDRSDVTHVQAANALDAWRALGWVHAQERGWQLEFNRRVMHGELSEILGEATLDTDRLLRALAVPRAARAQFDSLPADAREALQAYADGINAYHAGGGPRSPEFWVLGVQPGTWTAVDSVGWAIMMALDLGGNWGNEYARLSAARELPTERLWQLMTPYPGEAPATSVDLSALYRGLGVYRTPTGGERAAAPGPADGAATPAPPVRLAQALVPGLQDALARWSTDFVRDAGTVEGKGSNNWVVAGSHTRSGKPLLANDPHLGLSAPAIWYFARLQAPAQRLADGRTLPGLDVIGATFPGLPFVVLGRTAEAAWGVTNTGPDVQDLYLEQIHPDNPRQYRTPDGWAEFTTRTETIRVKGKPDVRLVLRETRHGPVLSDAQAFHGTLLNLDRYVLALRWSALDADNHTVLAGFQANRARSVDELREALSHWHSPMQNAVMADTAGRVAYKAVGRVPLRRPDNDIRGVAPSPGWDARYDWAGWIPYAETPEDDPAETAARGWHATANQRITRPGYPHFMGQDWNDPARYERIAQLLDATPRHDLHSMQQLHGDLLSLPAQRLLPHLQAARSGHPLAGAAREALRRFDGTMRPDQPGPAIFAVWVDELTRGLLVPRLGEARFLSLYGKRQFRPAVEGILARDDAWWCAPRRCAERRDEALDRALERLQRLLGPDVARWQWGELHPALSVHRPFGSVAPLAALFDVRVPTGGDNFTVNVGQYWPNDPRTPFANRHAASLRAVYDLADPERSVFIYQTGQSGHVFSPFYADMRAEWAAVQYRPLQLRPAAFRHHLELQPR